MTTAMSPSPKNIPLGSGRCRGDKISWFGNKSQTQVSPDRRVFPPFPTAIQAKGWNEGTFPGFSLNSKMVAPSSAPFPESFGFFLTFWTRNATFRFKGGESRGDLKVSPIKHQDLPLFLLPLFKREQNNFWHSGLGIPVFPKAALQRNFPPHVPWRDLGYVGPLEISAPLRPLLKKGQLGGIFLYL